MVPIFTIVNPEPSHLQVTPVLPSAPAGQKSFRGFCHLLWLDKNHSRSFCYLLWLGQRFLGGFVNILDLLPPLLVYLHEVESEYFECGGGGQWTWVQGHREWLNEVYFLGKFRHPNLVRLIGFCAQLTSLQEERLLVYEFVLHGSLENLLFQSTSFFMPMPWNRRVDVAADAACGLTFLHDHQVINRDIKPSNILVDHNFVAKLSDFGLARMGPQGDKTHVTTRVLGTWEYAAPEYIRTGHLTLQSDIWSFGIVLLELLSGRRAKDRHRPSQEQNLLVWAKPFLEQKLLSQLIDPQLDNRYSIEEANEVLSLVQQCLTKNPKNRPTMKEIFQRLSLLKDSKLKATDRTLSTTTVVETTETSMSSLIRESASQGVIQPPHGAQE
jgi:serine/threonine protein kinase